MLIRVICYNQFGISYRRKDMLNFEYKNKTEMVFGKDTENKVGELVKRFGNKVLLHYGSGSIKRNGVYDKIIASLEEHNVDYIELSGVVPNPRLSLVHEGIELCRKENVDFILAVGGGSAIDSAKAIAVGYFYDGNVWDFYTGKLPVEKALPVGVVLTISAAGSESSVSSVITNEDGMIKKSIGTEHIRPAFAILNPESTKTLPDYHTACGAVDMVAHVFERYFTNTENVELIDRLSEGLITTVHEQAIIAINDHDDYNSRAELMWAGALAHNNSLGVGRVQDWASHRIAHELSGVYDLAHGAALSIVFPAWMKYVFKTNIKRFLLFAKNIMKVEDQATDEETILLAIQKLEDYYKQIGMPTRISEAGIPTDNLEHLASRATAKNTITLGAFQVLNETDILNIYKLAQ